MLLAGCGGGTISHQGPLGRLHGKVTRGPLTPVCRAGIPCSGPASGAGLTFVSIGTAVLTPVTVAADGSYSVSLAPGRYGVTVSTRQPSIERIEPGVVHVTAGQDRTVNFRIDTGIR